ncbi:hypothetical protein [Amycolatopsis vastitatis]|nr:hypothetical protein [Amycolatopsis vastitatis]
MGMQPGWRWCARCSSLAYSGFGDGICVHDSAHDFGGSGEYFVSMVDVPEGSQPGWRWCNRCQCLCYSGFGDGDWCAAGGPHNFEGSGPYSVPLGAIPPSSQDGWRWCCTCLCLVYGESGGTCPSGGAHDFSRSGAYSVATAMPPPELRPSITVDRNSGMLRVDGEGFTPNARVNIRYYNDHKNLDLPTTANEIGRIAHNTGYRRAEGSCTVFARDETTGRTAIGSAGTWVPDNFPYDPVPIDQGTAFGEPDPRYE